MRIGLDRALAELTRGDAAPPPPTAKDLLHGLPARRRPLLPLAALCVTVVLAVVAAMVLLPRHGSSSQGSTPSPSSEFTWNGEDPSEQAFSDAEVARRCPLASGERYSTHTSDEVAGGMVTVLKANEADTDDGTTGTTCDLGYDFAPSRSTITEAEATSGGDQLVDACSKHTGLDLAGAGWKLVGSSSSRDAQNWTSTQVAFLWTPDGARKPRWLAACELDEGQPSASLQLTDLGSDQAVLHCPLLATDITQDDTGKQSTITRLGVDGPQPVMTATGLSLDTRVAQLVVGVPGHAGSATLRVTDGIALGHASLDPKPAVPVHGDDMVSLQVRMLDESGHQLRSCTTQG